MVASDADFPADLDQVTQQRCRDPCSKARPATDILFGRELTQPSNGVLVRQFRQVAKLGVRSAVVAYFWTKQAPVIVDRGLVDRGSNAGRRF